MPALAEPARPPLAPLRRLALLALGWGIYALAGPGVLLDDGTPLALLGLVPWGWTALRPGRFRLALEALTAGLALTSQVWWIAYVYWPPLVYIALGFAAYGALRGVLLRRLARRLRPALAVPLAWVGAETLRMTLPEPFGLSWITLGHDASATPLLAGSARLWGEIGLSYVLAALAGLLVELFDTRRPRAAALAWGLGPLAAALAAALILPVPATAPGPRIVCVQPAFEQERKSAGLDPTEQFADQLRLTREALAREPEPPDLVCWGETMLPLWLADPGLAARAAALEVDPWLELPEGGLPQFVADLQRWERLWVGRTLFGRGAREAPALPAGTSFLSGAVLLVAHEGRLRRQNAVVLWGPDGERRGAGAKQNLVPGAETLLGLERFDGARAFIRRVSGYVPDFLPALRTGVLELPGRAGRAYRIGTTVCYDNAVPWPYLQPVRDGGLDLHLVVSNEAWYLDSCEMDQMLAFSRLLAIETGRAMVRATNAGVTCALGPDGRELARLSVDGRDRLVPGTLAVTVPVPPDAARAAPPYVWLEPWVRGLAIALPLFLALIFGRRKGDRGGRRE